MREFPKITPMTFEEFFGIKVYVKYLIKREKIIAYAWHKEEKKALDHLKKIKQYHDLDGKIIESKEFDGWLLSELEKVIIKGEKFILPNLHYRNRKVYEELIKIPKGKTMTYSGLATRSGVKYTEVLITLMRNPFQVLIPCHRSLTQKGTLMGFYPLGKEVKKRLLEIEGIRCDG